MRRRRQQVPDPRPDWRDPQMPVLGKSGRKIDHRKMNIVAKMRLIESREPLWHNDPTYNMRRK